jgi:hypothetical protein
MNAERHRAPRLLAAAPNGATEAIMLAHGFTYTMLDAMVRDGLATMTCFFFGATSTSTFAGSMCSTVGSGSGGGRGCHDDGGSGSLPLLGQD